MHIFKLFMAAAFAVAAIIRVVAGGLGTRIELHGMPASAILNGTKGATAELAVSLLVGGAMAVWLERKSLRKSIPGKR